MEAGSRVTREDMIWAIGSLCSLHRIPFDSELALGQLPPPWDIVARQPKHSRCSNCRKRMVRHESATRHVEGGLIAVALSLYALATSAYLASWQDAGPYFPTVDEAADTYYSLYGPHCGDHHPTGWQSGWYGGPLQKNQVEYRVCNDQFQNEFSEWRCVDDYQTAYLPNGALTCVSSAITPQKNLGRCPN